MTCLESIKRFCTTSLGLLVGIASFACVILFLIGFIVGMAKTDQSVSYKHTPQVLFACLGLLMNFGFLYGVFGDNSLKWTFRIVLLLILTSSIAAGACMGLTGVVVDVCYQKSDHTQLMTSLHNDCGYSFLQFLAALAYSMLGVFQMFLTHINLAAHTKGIKVDDLDKI
eukprot:NODE_5456_length_652_cov_7.641905_g5292_i0.p1 GENE.NODE_5456_length_652_cov_7.641905_g5292_i0~~NODE_5456_length_652_cov_7.641905_g5292_i0.p1  ORF type:complete len:186 (+),score=83.17 NODE_5456_length_652_cov_7.641905_g5292_i0:52-558(+)